MRVRFLTLHIILQYLFIKYIFLITGAMLSLEVKKCNQLFQILVLLKRNKEFYLFNIGTKLIFNITIFNGNINILYDLTIHFHP